MSDEAVRFELARLAQYDDGSLIAEMRRVAALVPDDEPLTCALFDRHAKVHSTTLKRRFGGWRSALAAADLADRYSGRSVTSKMRRQTAKGADTADLVAELQRVASQLGSSTLSQPDFNAQSNMSASAVTRRMGSWSAALAAAGLTPGVMGRRYSDEDYFENLLVVWTQYGRQPKYREMDRPPSTITAGGYEKRFGGWTKALLAFIDYANTDGAVREPGATPSSIPTLGQRAATRRPQASQRSIPLGLRYDVLKRDRFRCAICGRSPATDPRCVLHVDHVQPFSKGGTTERDNLRTLCAECNLGKSAKIEVTRDA